MLVLFSGSGAGGFEILNGGMTSVEWLKLKKTVCRLLRAQFNENAAQLLESIPFELNDGTNYFGDEFSVLYAVVSLDKYIEIKELKVDQDTSYTFRAIAETFRELGQYVRFIAVDLLTEDGPDLVPQPKPENTTEIVERTLKDSEHLLFASGAVSAIDRVHTALHGYIKNICIKAGILVTEQASLTELFKALRTSHPVFSNIDIGEQETKKLFGALSTIIDTLNMLRNQASIAHPNEKILDDAEAILVINCTRTIFHYLETKLN